jgi:hypothetical protein
MQFIRIIFIFFFISIKIFAQSDTTASSSIEIMVIDSYITPERPNKFVLSFFTSDSCTSKLVVMNKYVLDVSKILSENHKIEIELNKLNIDSMAFKYQILVYDCNGKETRTESFEVALPEGFAVADELDPGLFSICIGGIIFAVPSPAYVFINGKHHWSLIKEIPLINFYSVGYNYPAGYIGLEYSHIFEAEKKNFLRVGYKQIFQVPGIKYISPGINYFSDFKGYNGLSAELSIGLIQIQNVFTLYTRYRYNFQLIRNGTNFHEISIGLYSNFFSLNL